MMSIERFRILVGDCREQMRTLDAGIARTCVTSPPYWGLRDYGVDGQLGLEQSPDAYVAGMVDVFREVRRVLSDDGTLWLNIGDSYAGNASPGGDTSRTCASVSNARSKIACTKRGSGIKPKDLVGIPWLLAFALRADGWYLRSEIIWHKPNPMPESVRDRPTKAHEHVFLLAKSDRYYYNADAIREPMAHPEQARRTRDPDARITGSYQRDSGRNDGSPHFSGGFRSDPDKGRNRRDVWTITPTPFKGAHFATMPLGLAEPCVLAGSRPDDLVLDPFTGAGTTGLVALRHGRRFVGTELNPEYAALAETRIRDADGKPIKTSKRKREGAVP